MLIVMAGYVSVSAYGCLWAVRWFLCSCHPQDATGKECGLHSGNVSSTSSDAEAGETTDMWTGGAVAALSKDQLAALKAGPRDQDTLVVLYAPWCQYSQVGCAASSLLFVIYQEMSCTKSCLASNGWAYPCFW